MSDATPDKSDDRQNIDDQEQADARQARVADPGEASLETGPLPEDTDAPDPERAFRHDMPDGSAHD